MRVDLHAHTYYSLLHVPLWKGVHVYQDSVLSPRLLVRVAARKKLDAVALTDHDTSRGKKKFVREAKKFGVIPLPGQEISKFDEKGKQWAHILTFNVDEIPWKIRFRPLEEFMDWLTDQNAVTILAHPFDLTGSTPSPAFDPKTVKLNLSPLKRFTLLETHNGFQPVRNNSVAQIVANKLGFPQTAGSDSHHYKMVGRCYMNMEGSTADDILEALRKQKKTTETLWQVHGAGAHIETYEDWFRFIVERLDWNLRSDIFRHQNPSYNIEIQKDVVYDALFFDFMGGNPAPKILLRAALRYVLPAALAALRITLQRILIKASNREKALLKDLARIKYRWSP